MLVNMLRVVQDTLNEHYIAFDSIENSVTAIHLATGKPAVLPAGLTSLGMPFQQFESSLQSLRIRIGCIFPELRGAELVDPC